MKIGVLGHLMLGLLTQGDRTGWELTRDFDTSLANVWAASHSQIYPELAKLEAADFIRKTEAGPRGSQRYAITPAGRAEVVRWLADTEPTDAPRSEWMVRVFFLNLLPPGQATAYLAKQGERHRTRMVTYRHYAEQCSVADPVTRWDRIALEAGIRFETAMAEWSAWAIGALGEDHPE